MDKDQLLERYIQGNLTPGEQQEFDRLLQDDSGFAGEVKFHTNLKRVIEAEEDGKTRKMVASFESQAGEQARPKRLIPTKWLAAAALVVIAGLGLLLFNNPSQSPGKLFDDHFDPYPNEVVPVVRGAAQDNPRVSAFTAYQNEEYQNAVLLFEHLKTQDPDPVYLFYQANALLQLHRADEALPLLQEHLAAGGLLSEKTHWYLAMAYLQLNEPENATKQLETVVANGGFRASEAKIILESLQ